MIRAEIHDDKFVSVSKFDATEWFEQAKDTEIKELMEHGWRGDYCADVVAEFFEGRGTGEPLTIDNVFAVCENTDTGYEVSIEPTDALRWLEEHRPHLYVGPVRK